MCSKSSRPPFTGNSKATLSKTRRLSLIHNHFQVIWHKIPAVLYLENFILGRHNVEVLHGIGKNAFSSVLKFFIWSNIHENIFNLFPLIIYVLNLFYKICSFPDMGDDISYLDTLYLINGISHFPPCIFFVNWQLFNNFRPGNFFTLILCRFTI